MKHSSWDPVERAVATLLDALAPILIPLEITPGRLAQIARTSFVKVSAKRARMRSSGRPHLAKIAAVTGLSRSEVKRIVAANYNLDVEGAENSPRAMRVLLGWRTSRAYTKNGKPKSLRITGRAPSFYSLCKIYSGDIPHKVILDELERQDRVVVARRRGLVTVCREKRRRNQSEYAALTFATMFLSDALRPDSVLVRRSEKIASSKNISDAYAEKAIAGRVTELLDQIPNVFVGNKKPKRNLVNVFALVARSIERE
jgi:hypothetical protein